MAFTITMVDSGGAEVRFPCKAGETVAEGAEAAGFRVISCASGYCGACSAALVRGEVTPSAGGSLKSPLGADHILLCRTVPLSDLEVRPRFGWMRTGAE